MDPVLLAALLDPANDAAADLGFLADWLKERDEWHWPRLLGMVLAHPGADGPRLLASLWLEEHDQPERAEFVRVQVEIARTSRWLRTECKVCGATAGEDGVVDHGRGCYVESEDGGGSTSADENPLWEALRRREWELLPRLFAGEAAWCGFPAHYAVIDLDRMRAAVALIGQNILWQENGSTWSGSTWSASPTVPLLPWPDAPPSPRIDFDPSALVLSFRRGFVHALSLTAAAFLAHEGALLAAQPVRAVKLTTWPEIEGVIAQGVNWWRLTGRRERLPHCDYRLPDAALHPLLAAEWPHVRFELPLTAADFEGVTGQDVLDHVAGSLGIPPELIQPNPPYLAD